MMQIITLSANRHHLDYPQHVNAGDIIGLNIKNLRNKTGLKRDDFAEKIGIEGGHLYRIEKGLNMPGSLIIINVCKAFKVSSDELLGLTAAKGN